MAAGGWPPEFNNAITYNFNNINGFNDMMEKNEPPLLPFSTDFSGLPMMDCWDYAVPVLESFLDSFPSTEATYHLYHPPPTMPPPPTMYYHNHSCSSSMDATFPNPHLSLSPECEPVQVQEMSTNKMYNNNTEYVSSSNELGAVVWNSQFNKGDQNLNQQMKRQQMDVNNEENGGILKVGNGEKKRPRNYKQVKDEQQLSWKIISQYFYMPITQAAKELNIGLTLLKKRCRELGIRRWPHRKLMSLQTLINNVQELGKEGSEERLKMAVEVLERERKLMEELPDMQLEYKTKKLRQACFKANYKKRKMMGVNGSCGNTKRASSDQFSYSFRGDGSPSRRSCTASVCSSYNGIKYIDEEDEEEDDDEMRSLLSDCFSTSDNSLMV